MIVKILFSTVLVLLLVALGGFISHHTRRGEGSTTTKLQSQNSSQTVVSAAIPAQTALPAAPSSSASSTSEEVQKPSHGVGVFREMSASKNLRVFAEEMKRRPGGYSYALEALHECRAVRETLQSSKRLPSENHANTLESNGTPRDIAIRRITERCRDFTDVELGGGDLKFFAESVGVNDPLKLKRDDLHQSVAQGAAVDVVAQAAVSLLDIKDPLMLRQLEGALLNVDHRTSDRGISYVDGRPFGGLDDWRQFRQAWQLASCRYLSTCDVQDAQVMQSCAFDGVCASNVGSMVRLAINDDGLFGRIDGVANEIALALQSRNVRRLMPP